MTTLTSLPTEVTLYHPIEFLELDKFTFAYLDLGLEQFKGGIKNQLLVGHLIHFIQNNGLVAISKFPRYKLEFVENLIQKCDEKGIDLRSIKKETYNLNWDRLQTLSDSVSVHEPSDPFEKAANIYASSNYYMFNLLPFNRTIARSHVSKLVSSIKENGVLSYPLMIYTDCIDGEFKYWIVDGQHRFDAFRKMGLPIRFTMYQKQTAGKIDIYDIVRLVARINNTSLKWNLHQYLFAWQSIKVPEYVSIYNVYNNTKIAITVLLQAYSGESRGRATELFTDGRYKMTDEENGGTYVSYIRDLLPIIPKSTAYQSALLNFFRTTKNYDNERMKHILTKVRNTYVFGENHDTILLDLQGLYNKAA